MGVIRSVLITIVLIVATLLSIVGIMIEMPPMFGWVPTRVNLLGQSFLDVMRLGHGMMWFWLSLLLTVLIITWLTLINSRKRMKVEVQMGGGKVVIMDSAIKKYIRNALSELSEVTVRKINLRDSRSGLRVDLVADVRTHENLPVLERRIISRVRAALAEDLGITKLSEVHVLVRDFDVSGRPVHPAKTQAETSESEPVKVLTPATDNATAQRIDDSPSFAVAEPVELSETVPQDFPVDKSPKLSVAEFEPDTVSYDRSEFNPGLSDKNIQTLSDESSASEKVDDMVAIFPEQEAVIADSEKPYWEKDNKDDNDEPPTGPATDKILL